MFKPDEKLIEVVKNFDENILWAKVSPERINDELCKILVKGNIDEFILSGFIGKIIPEYKQFDDKTFKNQELQHICRVIKNCRASGDVGFMLAGLFHDVGKATTGSFTESKNRWQFINHEMPSMDAALNNMRKLKFSNNEIKRVAFIVKNHMFIKFPHKDLTIIKFILKNNVGFIKDTIQFNAYDWNGKTEKEQETLNVVNRQKEIEHEYVSWIRAIEHINDYYKANLQQISMDISNNSKIPMNERGKYILDRKALEVRKIAKNLNLV